jgi:hypothetical protein
MAKPILKITNNLPGISSPAWGPPSLAAHRATLEQMVTADNERLLRTYHPSLECCGTVSIQRCPDGQRIWCVWGALTTPIAHTHAGGLEIHVLPDYCIPYSLHHNLIAGIDHIGRYINPRRVLTRQDLDKIGKMFPASVGAQVLIGGYPGTGGFMVILYQDMISMELDWGRATPSTVGGMHVVFRLLNCIPTAEFTTGTAVRSAGCEGTVCLGLKLAFQDGTTAITTVTHGFVNTNSIFGDEGIGGVLSNMAAGIENWATPRRRRPGAQPWSSPFVRIDRRPILGNSPIGKEVRLHENKHTVIGKIRYTYDWPSLILPFPAGYRCDLSLICGDSLPNIRRLEGQPAIVGWADMAKVLAGTPIFVTAYVVTRGSEGWEAMAGSVNDLQRPALVQGVQYLWQREYLHQNICLLWRTVGRKDVANAQGYSGSVLCMGEPNHKEVKAVVFQNFQQPWRNFPIGDPPMYIKAGFFLPPEIRQTTIDCGVTRESRGRSSKESRRSFSNDV